MLGCGPLGGSTHMSQLYQKALRRHASALDQYRLGIRLLKRQIHAHKVTHLLSPYPYTDSSIRSLIPHPHCPCCSSVHVGGCCKVWMLCSSGGWSLCLPARPSTGAPGSPAILASSLLSCRWRCCTACIKPSCRWSRYAGGLSLKRLRLLYKVTEWDVCMWVCISMMDYS